jgi:membrane-bound ClpP family serine protease
VKITVLHRLLLSGGVLLAAYQIVAGINDLDSMPVTAYTIGFGVLLLAGLLLIILGFDALDSPVVAVVSTIIPLSISLGLVWEHAPSWREPYLAFVIVGFLAIAATRAIPRGGRLPTYILSLVHGVAGVIIFLLPILLVVRQLEAPSFALIGLGGALIGVGGLLLSFLRSGKPILPRETILQLLPVILLLMTAAFVAGFMFS